MPDYDKLAAQFGGSTDPGQAPDKYDLAAQKFGGVAGGAAPAAKPVGTVDRVRAAAAGVNKGFFSDLVGLPVDTIANVLDLGRAGIGTITAAAGRPDLSPSIPDRSTIVGSSDWIAAKLNAGGLGNAINNPNPQDAVSRILHTGGRVAGASVVPNPRAPVSAATQLANAGMGALSGLATGAVSEIAPDWAGLAGMLPGAAAAGAAAGIRRGVRGDEAGRRAMEQRIKDLKDGGIDTPSAGLASGNQFVMGLENLLSQVPGSVGIYQAAKERNLAGMKSKVDALRDTISSDFGPVTAGSAIQSDLKGAFRDRVNATTRALNDRVADLVGRDAVVPIDATLAKGAQLSTPIKGAEATTADLVVPRIARIAENLRSDVFGAPPVSARPLSGNPTANLALTPEVPQVPVNNSSLWNIPVEPGNPLLQASVPQAIRTQMLIDSLTNLPKKSAPNQPLPQRAGPNATLNLPLSQAVEQEVVANPSLWNIPTAARDPLPQRAQSIGRQDISNASLWNAQKEQGIPFGALKALRTSIGDEANSPAILGTPEGAQFKQLYGAMSQDMRQAVNAADRQNAGVDVGPLLPGQMPASLGLNRANTFYSRAATRAEDLNGIANRDTPEGAYSAVVNSLNNGPSLYEKLRGAVDPATRQKLVATIIDDLGTAKAGQQNAAGDVWSPRTFLTNYAKLYENGGGDALFKRLPGGEQHAESLAKIAKVAEMVGDSSKVWANPSGTSAATFARGTLGAVGGGFLIAPFAAAKAGGGLLLTNQVSKRLLLNPRFVNWLARAPQTSPAKAQASLQRLTINAKMWGDKQLQQDVATYIDALNEGDQSEN